MGLHDVGLCITWGWDGNLYVGGKTVEAGGDAFSIISLTDSGVERWKWLPTWDGYNGVYSIVLGSDSNVYASGWIGSKAGGYEFTMGAASVTNEGNERWHLAYGDPGTISGVCDQLVWDDDRRLMYTVGMISGPPASAEFTVLAFGDGQSLTCDPQELSAGDGGVVDFTLSAGADHAIRTYYLLGSLSGTEPGTLLPGGLETLPLNWDLFTKLVLSLMNTSYLNDFHGDLDADGEGAARLDTQGPIPPVAVGSNIHFAYALSDPWDFASNPVALEILP